MTTTIPKSSLGESPLTSHHLRTIKKDLRDIILGSRNNTSLDHDELDIIDKEASELLALIRSRKNGLSPVNRLPPDVLVLIPEFWDEHERDETVIALTHVCRAWREVFTSRASLWTNFHCMNAEKARVYLERSKAAPVHLWLKREDGFSDNDPFFEVAPYAVGRLKCLTVKTTPDHLEDITEHFAQPAPHLEFLTINGGFVESEFNPTLPATLFGGDLSSLRGLHLHSVCTQLPWRNMSNLRSFSLADVEWRSTFSVEDILDFFESATRLLEVTLSFATPVLGGRNGRLVSLKHLKQLSISGSQSPSLLLEHLVIPVGAKVSTELSSPGPRIEDHLPRTLRNLQNLSKFTGLRFKFEQGFASVSFSGPNGEVSVTSSCPGRNATRLAPGSLTYLDTSGVRSLEIIGAGPITREFCQVLSSCTSLRTLTVDCDDTFTYLEGLNPAPSRKGSILCPKLEEILFRTEEQLAIEDMANIVAARSLRGAVLKTLKIIGAEESLPGEGIADPSEHKSLVETLITRSVCLAKVTTKKTADDGALVTVLASGV